MSKALKEYLEEIPDFRRENKNFRHSLLYILLLSVCAVFRGAEDFEDITLFGREKLEFLQKFIPFANGVPSHDTIGRVFLYMDTCAFNEQFIGWMEASIGELSGKQIAIDDKSLRGSKTGLLRWSKNAGQFAN